MKLILSLLIAIGLTACANVDMTEVSEDQRTFTSIVEVDGLARNEAYQRAQEWVALTYNSANDVIQSKNEKTGRIIGKGITTAKVDLGTGPLNYWRYSHSIVIDTKDNKARLVLSDFISLKSGYPPRYAYLYYPVKDSVQSVLSSFEQYMRTGGNQTVDSDW